MRERKYADHMPRYQLHFLGPRKLDFQRLHQKQLLCLVDKVQRAYFLIPLTVLSKN